MPDRETYNFLALGYGALPITISQACFRSVHSAGEILGCADLVLPSRIRR